MQPEYTENVFSKIMRGELPAEVVYQDDATFAFLDINPNHLGHTLVIPKASVRNIFDMDEVTLTHFIKTIQKVAIAVKAAMNADGINLIMNNEEGAGQAVFHAHMHVIPRYDGDGYTAFPHVTYGPGEEAATAEKIRASLG